MRRKVRTLETTVEIATGGDPGAYRNLSESMEVQLDRWRMEQADKGQTLTVVAYDLHTLMDGNLMTTIMTILYCNSEDLEPYGALGVYDPLEVRMYATIESKVGVSKLAGRALALGMSPLPNLLQQADVEYADSTDWVDQGPIFDVVIVDRVFSIAADPQFLATKLRGILQPGGCLIVCERGYMDRSARQVFSREGLRTLLSAFKVKEVSGVGGCLDVVHKIASYDKWAPLRPTWSPADLDCPVYVWAVAYG